MTLQSGADAAVGVPTTYLDHSYAATVKNPSADKPQSKLWYTDGSWWALMVPPGGADVHICRLNRSAHSWVDTGVQVDARTNSTGDALWTAADQTLTVVSRTGSANPRVLRYSYDAVTGSYSLDNGFPVTIQAGGGSESATIDRDSTGRLWITYTRSGRLWVAHSDTSGQNWTDGFNPNVGDYVLDSDDISSIIAFDGNIGLMWSDQGADTMRFAIHHDGDPDSVWSVENALAGTRLADDHINLKQVTGDAQGRVFAAVKTSQGDSSSDPRSAPLVGVLVRTPGSGTGPGTWSFVPAGTVADDHTRPIIMIDQTNQDLYFFATAPGGGGDIYYKKTPLSNVSFANQPGKGKKFVDASPAVNNASGSKDPVTASSGLVILAVADSQKRYVHAEMDLAGGGSPPPPPQDVQPPSTPQNLDAAPSPDHVDLSWDQSTDDIGVANYIVRRDGVVIGQPAGPSFRDGAVTPGATYDYTVAAGDASGKTSADTDPLSVLIPDVPPPGSGIELRGATSAANAATNALLLPVPTHQAGDVLLAGIAYRGKPTVTPPAGWTLVRLDVNGTAVRQATYVHVADGSEPGALTFSFSAKPAAVGSMLAYSGVSGSTPVSASAGQATSSGHAITAPSVNAAQSGSMLVTLFSTVRRVALTNPPAMSELTEVASPAGVTYPVTGEAAGQLLSSVGATGTRVATSSNTGSSLGTSILLAPA